MHFFGLLFSTVFFLEKWGKNFVCNFHEKIITKYSVECFRLFHTTHNKYFRKKAEICVIAVPYVILIQLGTSTADVIYRLLLLASTTLWRPHSTISTVSLFYIHWESVLCLCCKEKIQRFLSRTISNITEYSRTPWSRVSLKELKISDFQVMHPCFIFND